MKLRAGNVWTHVVGWPGDPVAKAREALFLHQYLSLKSPGAFFSEAYKKGHWDGHIRLYDQRGERFPTGLVRMVLERGHKVGIPVELEDAREKLAQGPVFRGEWLRPYQREAVEAALKRTRGIVSMPTGVGKTELVASLALSIPGPALALVDTKDLLHQMADRFDKRAGGSERAGRYGAGVCDLQRFTVATFQTVLERWDDLVTQGLLMMVRALYVDEVQVLPGAQYYKVPFACVNAYYRVGFSATPNVRKDKLDFKAVAALGPIIHHASEQAMVAGGAIVPMTVRFVRFQHGEYDGWNLAREEGIVTNEARNALLMEMVAAAERPTILHTRMTPHGFALLKLLRGAGWRSDFAWGETPTHSRKEMVKRLERRDLDVLVASTVFKKGIDIPELRSVVNGAGGDSPEDAIQLAGRAGRAVAGKAGCEYWDVRDRGDKILSKHAKHRMDALRGRGWDVQELDEMPVDDPPDPGQ